MASLFNLLHQTYVIIMTASIFCLYKVFIWITVIFWRVCMTVLWDLLFDPTQPKQTKKSWPIPSQPNLWKTMQQTEPLPVDTTPIISLCWFTCCVKKCYVQNRIRIVWFGGESTIHYIKAPQILQNCVVYMWMQIPVLNRHHIWGVDGRGCGRVILPNPGFSPGTRFLQNSSGCAWESCRFWSVNWSITNLTNYLGIDNS